MALAWPIAKKSEGLHLIDNEIDRLSRMLQDRKLDLERAEKQVADLQDTCRRLELKILSLNHDRQALVG